MGSQALVISIDGTIRPLELPEDPQLRRRLLDETVGGCAEHGRYHPEATVYVNSARGQQPNVVAWALISAWRGLDVSYYLYGTAVVAASAPGVDLPGHLADQVRAAADCVRRVAAEWRTRHPASAEEGARELLAEVRFHVPAGV